MNKIKHVLRTQCSEIKRTFLRERTKDERFNKSGYNDLFKYFCVVNKQILGDAPDAISRLLPDIYKPTIIIKMKNYIKENLPDYAKRIL